MDKASAGVELARCIDLQAKEGYDVAFSHEKATILVDKKKNILHLERAWSLFKGYYVREQSLEYEKLKQVKVTILPPGLGSAYYEYTLGGLAVGGIAGLIVGSLIDAIRGPKKEHVSIHFEFDPGWNGMPIFYYAYVQSGVPMIEEQIKLLVNQIVPLLDKLKELFAEKVKL